MYDNFVCNNLLLTKLASFSKKRTIIIIMCLSEIIIFDLCNFKTANIVSMAYAIIGILIIIYAKTIHKKRLEKYVEEYRRKWNETFKDNSFDRFFSKSSFYSMDFDFDFTMKYRDRLFYENFKNKSRNDSYNNFKRTPNNSNLSSALEYFGYTSIREVTIQDLKSKYKGLIKKYHPDNNGDAEKFKKTVDYYKVIEQSL